MNIPKINISGKYHQNVNNNLTRCVPSQNNTADDIVELTGKNKQKNKPASNGGMFSRIFAFFSMKSIMESYNTPVFDFIAKMDVPDKKANASDKKCIYSLRDKIIKSKNRVDQVIETSQREKENADNLIRQIHEGTQSESVRINRDSENPEQNYIIEYQAAEGKSKKIRVRGGSVSNISDTDNGITNFYEYINGKCFMYVKMKDAERKSDMYTLLERVVFDEPGKFGYSYKRGDTNDMVAYSGKLGSDESVRISNPKEGILICSKVSDEFSYEYTSESGSDIYWEE